jgi:hypothetical protein
MGLLTTAAVAGESRRSIHVTIRTGRTTVLLALCVAALGAAAVLHGLDRETAAAWFTGMGEALLFGVLGVIVGEKSGAKEAEEKLLA